MLTLLLACSAPTHYYDHPEGVEGVDDAPDEQVVDDTQDEPGDDPDMVPITLELTVDENPNSTITPLATLATDEPFRVEFWAEDVPVRSTPLREGTVPVIGLHAETTWSLQAVVETDDGENRSPVVEWTTGALPSGLVDYRVSQPWLDADDGLVTLMGPADPTDYSDKDPYLVGVDRMGEVVWYLDPPDLVGLERDAKFGPNGNLWVSSGTQVHVFDITGEWLHTITAPGRLHHDIEPLANGNVLAMVRVEETHDVPAFGDGVTVSGDEILELTPNGDVVWSWNAFDHLEIDSIDPHMVQHAWDLYGLVDWTHANSLQLAADGTLVVSFRNLNAVAGIDRDTGELDFYIDSQTGRSTPTIPFGAQHSARLAGDELTLFDNLGAETSRAMRMVLNDNGTVEEIWSWDVGVRNETHGDYRPLADGTGFVTAVGSRDVIYDGTITQIDEATGEVLWELAGFEDRWIYRSVPIDGWIEPLD